MIRDFYLFLHLTVLINIFRMLQKNHKKRFDINQVENEFNGILRGRKDIIPITSKNIFEG